MLTIYKKELSSFFSNSTGYTVMALFISFTSCMLWVFQSPFNIINTGYANLTPLFILCPWVFIFLIPAITMQSFTEEYNHQTIEILKTKPLSSWNIILGKFIAALSLVLISLTFTSFTIYTIFQLGNPVGNLDVGTTVGSYLGLLFIGSAYCAIGIFTSSICKNQITAFLVAVTISAFLYYGFDALTLLFNQKKINIESLGMHTHFESIARGVVDTRDLVYFLCVTTFFLAITKKLIN